MCKWDVLTETLGVLWLSHNTLLRQRLKSSTVLHIHQICRNGLLCTCCSHRKQVLQVRRSAGLLVFVTICEISFVWNKVKTTKKLGNILNFNAKKNMSQISLAVLATFSFLDSCEVWSLDRMPVVLIKSNTTNTCSILTCAKTLFYFFMRKTNFFLSVQNTDLEKIQASQSENTRKLLMKMLHLHKQTLSECF